MSPADVLTGRCIGVPESRQLDLFADMLEKRGATVVRCPLVDIRDAPDAAPVRAWVDSVIAQGLSDMIWLTGEGVRRIDAFVQAIDASTDERFWAAQAQARQITRGPKPVRELKPLGIGRDIAATEPTTAGVIDALSNIDLTGHRVGVQLYGTEPNTPLQDALTSAGAEVWPVAPYIYADDAEDAAVAGFIDQIVTGGVDAVAFTSSPQVRRLFKVARKTERLAALQQALGARCVAAVGPLVADTLAEQDITVDLMPESSYFMKPLVRALTDHFTRAANAGPTP